MVRCHVNEDCGGAPISKLRGTDCVLFPNGVIASMKKNENEFVADENYIFEYYSYPNQIRTPELKEGDPISEKIAALVDLRYLWLGTFVLIGVLLILDRASFSIYDLLYSNLPWKFPFIILILIWLVLWGGPALLYGHLTEKKDTETYIEIYHKQKSKPYKITAGRSEWMDFWTIFSYAQRIAVCSAVLTFRPGLESGVDVLLGAIGIINALLAMPLLLFLICIPFLLLERMSKSSKNMVPVQTDGIEEFHKKMIDTITYTLEMNQSPIEELIAMGEGYTLEFKGSYWTNTEGPNIDQRNKCLEDVVIKVVSGMLNCDGGTIMIGVNDKKPYGPTGYIAGGDCSHSKTVDTPDGLVDHITRKLRENIFCAGQSLIGNWTVQNIPYKDNIIIRINVEKGPNFVTCFQKHAQKKARHNRKQSGLSDEELDREMDDYGNPKYAIDKKFRFLRQGSLTGERSPDSWEIHISQNWRKFLDD